MSVTGRALGTNAQVASSATTYYTATNVRARIDKMTLCNTTAGAIAITVYKITSGGSATAINAVISAKSIAAGDTYTCPEMVGHWLNTGDFIQAFASSASSVSIAISGIETT